MSEQLQQQVVDWAQDLEKRLQTEYGAVLLPCILIMAEQPLTEIRIDMSLNQSDVPVVSILRPGGQELMPSTPEYDEVLSQFLTTNKLKAQKTPEKDYDFSPGSVRLEVFSEALRSAFPVGKPESEGRLTGELRHNLKRPYIETMSNPTYRYNLYALTPAFFEAVSVSTTVQELKDNLKIPMAKIGPLYMEVLKTAVAALKPKF